MKIDDTYEDRKGRCPLVFSGFKKIKEVYDYLWRNYQGYHFTVMFDMTKDEYEEPDSKLYVYFSDEALEEIACYSGARVIKEE